MAHGFQTVVSANPSFEQGEDRAPRGWGLEIHRERCDHSPFLLAASAGLLRNDASDKLGLCRVHLTNTRLSFIIGAKID
jgi:hypothetical protein